ncbi:TPA: hypothetical protein HA281_06490 [Candidatus Woesearchaeota archaeon]|nr:MAG: hypothetical protein QT04_C0034G0004 [archaeon GW2011_AR11]HIH92418.1 hypothetical protein [Candidatus Woesearchaeota archaeon]HII64105.1 hypothetical protein [Candidatus Woesearchaeota archaeon]
MNAPATVLEKRVMEMMVHLVSNDPILTTHFVQTFKPNFESSGALIRDSNLEMIVESSGAYVYDLSSSQPPEYPLFVSVAHRLTAINPLAKIIFLATEEQQASDDFAPIKQLVESSRAIIHSRPPAYGETAGGTNLEQYAESIYNIIGDIVKDIKQPYPKNGKIEEGTIIKVGGSLLDLYKKNPNGLRNLLGASVEAHDKGYRIVLTVGGGPSNSVSKDMAAAYSLPAELRGENTERVLDVQARIIAYVLNDIKSGLGQYVSPEDANMVLRGNYINRELLDGQIPVFSLLPRDPSELGLPKDIPRDKSDAHAVYLANHLGMRRVIFAKNTDGIYERDPNVPDDRLDELGLKHENRPIRFLYANQVDTRIKRISIESDGRVTDEHLIETAALKPFIELKYPITIQIVDGTKPDKLITALEGNVATGSYILKP